MDDLSQIDLIYKKYSSDLNAYLPDGLIQVDLELLQELNLLSFHKDKNEPGFTRYFQVVESEDRITLMNEQFVVWIVPEKVDNQSLTYVLIATNHHEEEPHLEIAFSVAGAYNTSRLVLHLLEKYLIEIQDTEDSLASLRTNKK